MPSGMIVTWSGDSATGMVSMTVFVNVLITDTLLLTLFTT
ncbi:40-residue YVTN family beta-propeller repeat protein [Bacillus mycoides]|uniref:40-residue YVTN family beta-propeller repeat protein n=1 Tax=Bacillus mycoides TaxID=1405 RepID=C2XU24_BACMY|nr:40-residue YVTN family beta-propeller repeat protein [Bacillus mycoides]